MEKECECAVGGHFRRVEREIRKYGRDLPLLQRHEKLTMRGVNISSIIKKNYEVIETHPRTSQNILGFKDSLSGLSQYYNISYLAVNTNCMQAY